MSVGVLDGFRLKLTVTECVYIHRILYVLQQILEVDLATGQARPQMQCLKCDVILFVLYCVHSSS